jgi:pre-rRNA-processing protein IPI3
LSDHTLPVRAIAISQSGKRAWTASEDGTVKMWSLTPSFELLATFSFPGGSIPTSVVVDPGERFFYAGTSKGEVFECPLYRRRGEVGEMAAIMEAVGGAGAGGAPIKSEGCVISHK